MQSSTRLAPRTCAGEKWFFPYRDWLGKDKPSVEIKGSPRDPKADLRKYKACAGTRHRPASCRVALLFCRPAMYTTVALRLVQDTGRRLAWRSGMYSEVYTCLKLMPQLHTYAQSIHFTPQHLV
jgi:hypothetical protein